MIQVWRALKRPIALDEEIKQHLITARVGVAGLWRQLEMLDRRLGELEAQDRMGNFEIQELMSEYNEAERLASDVTKKLDCLYSDILSKIG